MITRCLRATALTTCLAAGSALAADKAIVVLDASGSMWGQIDGRAKIEIARDTLSSVLGSVPDNLELGLIAYGHRTKGECSDIEEIVPPGPDSRDRIAAAVAGLSPKGKTPLTASVRQAAEALRFTEDKATVILVTDGIETCEADPCAVAAELEQMGVDFTAHVVGFGLSEEEGRQVACIAENTGGTFIDAKNAGELTEALTRTVAAAPAPEPEPEKAAVLEDNVAITAVLAEGREGDDINGGFEFFALDGDKPAADAVVGGYGTTAVATLDPGRYLLRYRKDMVTEETVVEVIEGERVERDLELDAGVLEVAVLAAEGESPANGGRFDVTAGEATGGGYGTGILVVPAGDVHVAATLGQGETEETVTVAAGETVKLDLVVGIGVLTVTAVYADGGPAVEDGGMYVEVVSAKKALDGSRKAFGGGYGPENAFQLPPGEYLVQARLGQATAEAPAKVVTGEASDVEVVLNAGVLAAAAPGAYSIEVLDAKKDLQGNRDSVAHAYGEELQTTLPPGDYVLLVRVGDSGEETKERAVTVRAAERTEATVE